MGWETFAKSLIWEVQLDSQRLHTPEPTILVKGQHATKTSVFFPMTKTDEISLHLIPFTNPKQSHMQFNCLSRAIAAL